ncbi:amidohydrolase [Pseudogemmobacter humi]|uniref:N-substituted formamide deformylase n=1 Tax=Pseudogemmobacter humi TaxID=2483812 RepID=A0A3P5XFT1_9RHOB|nr:amidohydrolase family protein [Pseudogemmobacter humi]VDC33614.1 N-substituted formamide deformylase precursor [Pseudogemmobacter humi]
MTNHAETVVLGQRVITMEPGARRDWQGVAIRDGRITRLIRRSELAEVAGPHTVVHDLGERVLMPGFVDVHAHSEVMCRTGRTTIDCRAPGCGSVADVQEILSQGLAGRAPGEWIVGQANLFFDRKLAGGRLPTRAELDRVSCDHPIALRAGGHITVLNSKALEVSGIDRNYVPPAFSTTGPPQVERDAGGEPTGVVKEMDMLLPLPTVAADDLKPALEAGIRESFTRYGVTCIGEISETTEGMQAFSELAEEGRLPAAMRFYIWAPGTMKLEHAARWREHFALGADPADVRVQGIKLFADGGFSARSAAVTCPYLGTDSCGEIAFSKYFFRRAVELTAGSGLQLSVHANGDRAQQWLCARLLELGGATSGPTRMRIEHAANLMPDIETMEWWARAGIIPSPQAVFIYTFGEYFADYLGDFGRRGLFPFRSLMEQGWRLNASSDVWVGSEPEATNPFFSIWCSLKRQAWSGAILAAEEAIPLEEALRMHTLDGAATLGEADVRGSLAPGKYADIIAPSADPFAVPIDALRHLEADFVMARGRCVLDRNGTVSAAGAA